MDEGVIYPDMSATLRILRYNKVKFKGLEDGRCLMSKLCECPKVIPAKEKVKP